MRWRALGVLVVLATVGCSAAPPVTPVAPATERTTATVAARDLLDGLRVRPEAAGTRAERDRVDHTVPLLEVWRSGADARPARQLAADGNDLGYRWSLQAVSARMNEDEGNVDPARWLPPRNRCASVGAWIAVEARWALAVDATELRALEDVLERCGDLRVEAPGAPDLDSLT